YRGRGIVQIRKKSKSTKLPHVIKEEALTMTYATDENKRPYVRVHNMTAKHRANVLSILCSRYGDVTSGKLNVYCNDPDGHSFILSKYIKLFQPHQIDDAHYEATRRYSNTRVWSRGRPRGSRNKSSSHHNFD